MQNIFPLTKELDQKKKNTEKYVMQKTNTNRLKEKNIQPAGRAGRAASHRGERERGRCQEQEPGPWAGEQDLVWFGLV